MSEKLDLHYLKMMDILHKCLRTHSAVARYLGFNVRSVMYTRARLKAGKSIRLHIQAEILKKFILLKESRNVADYIQPNHIYPSTGRKECEKARKTIENMLKAGNKRKEIYEFLVNAGRMSISYQYFCWLLGHGFAQTTGSGSNDIKTNNRKKALNSKRPSAVKKFRAAKSRKRMLKS